jgi:hypothetical protein
MDRSLRIARAGEAVTATTIALTLWLATTAIGCSESKDEPGSRAKASLNVDRLPGDKSQARAALTADFRWLEDRFPTFRWEATSRLVTTAGDEKDSLAESYLLARDSEDTIHGRRQNSDERGFEFYWKDGVYYFRNRYRPLQHRKAGRAEMRREAQKTWGMVGACWSLLDRFVKLGEPKKKSVGGRKAYRYPLLLRKKPGAPKKTDLPRRKWRRSVKVEKLSGHVVLDKKTGGVLEATLTATYTFVKPSPPDDLLEASRNGPTGARGDNGGDGKKPRNQKTDRRVAVELSLTHKLDPSSPNEPITIPDSIAAPVRDRNALDRRALLGNTPRPGWYRGGGPVRAWLQRKKRSGRARRRRRRPPNRRRRSRSPNPRRRGARSGRGRPRPRREPTRDARTSRPRS